jgi:hypothetical protein
MHTANVCWIQIAKNGILRQLRGKPRPDGDTQGTLSDGFIGAWVSQFTDQLIRNQQVVASNPIASCIKTSS